ncbi:hypothetical protein BH11ARM1_BH11ARM1_14380 [soil metagenome]
MPEEYEGEDREDLNEPPPFFPNDTSLPTREQGSMGELVEVQIEGVWEQETNNIFSRFVLLTDGTRRLPIVIGPFEAQAITSVLEREQADRPMTHDLIKNVIDKLNATVDRVVIDDFWSSIYYAKIYLQSGDNEMEIDARPSDAIALAARFEAPILVAEGILESGIVD